VVGTAEDPGADGADAVCANAAGGVAQSSRIKEWRTRMLGEKPAREICVVIDSGAVRAPPPSVNAIHRRVWDLGKFENVPLKLIKK